MRNKSILLNKFIFNREKFNGKRLQNINYKEKHLLIK